MIIDNIVLRTWSQSHEKLCFGQSSTPTVTRKLQCNVSPVTGFVRQHFSRLWSCNWTPWEVSIALTGSAGESCLTKPVTGETLHWSFRVTVGVLNCLKQCFYIRASACLISFMTKSREVVTRQAKLMNNTVNVIVQVHSQQNTRWSHALLRPSLASYPK